METGEIPAHLHPPFEGGKVDRVSHELAVPLQALANL